MKGFIKHTLAALSLAGGLTFFSGCYSSCQEKVNHCIDPCWPERYTAMASDSVSSSFAPQVENGHVLDQTIWNDQFDRGTAVLTPAGMDHLAHIARQRPWPDPRVFLQTAFDVKYDPMNSGKYAEDRNKLDNERKAAILDYLNADTATRGVAFNVIVHDPHEVGMHSVPMLRTISDFSSNFKGTLPISAGGGGGMAASK